MQVLDYIGILEFMTLVFRYVQNRRIQRTADDQDDLDMVMIGNMFL